MPFLWGAGGEILAFDESDNRWRAVFDSPAAADALDFYVRLTTEPWTDAAGKPRRGYVVKDTAESNLKWRRGQLGMTFAYIDEKLFATLNPDVTGMAPLPIGPATRGTEINARMMGIFAGVTNPLVRDAAWEYVRFQNSPEADAVRVKHLVEGGLGRFLHPDRLRAHGYESVAATIPAEWRDCLAIALADGRPEPYGRNANVIYDILTVPIRRAEELALSGQLATEPDARRAQLLDLLRDARRKADADMLGLVPPDELRRRRAAAFGLLLLLAASVVFAVRQMVRIFLPGRKSVLHSRRRFLPAALLLAPAAAHHLPLGLRAPVPRRGDGVLRLPHFRRLDLGVPRQLRQPAVGSGLVARAVDLRPLCVSRHFDDLYSARAAGHPPAGSPARQNPFPRDFLSARVHHRPRRRVALEDVLRAVRGRPDQPPRDGDAGGGLDAAFAGRATPRAPSGAPLAEPRPLEAGVVRAGRRPPARRRAAGPPARNLGFVRPRKLGIVL
jgi:hypothetical protein